MNTTIVLTQTLGIIMTVVGISLLVSKKNAVALLETMTQSAAITWLSGFIALVFGAVIISLNNIWSGSSLQLFITVIGWLAILKGAFILVFPNTAVPFYKKANKGGLFVLVGVVVFVVGLILLYKGF